jgi:hypothetical protein
MFSISSAQFPDLTELSAKIKSSSLEKSEFDDIRSWCADRGFLIHFSKTGSSSGSSSPPSVFYTLKYDRAKLTAEQYETVGRFRSVVFDTCGRICCVAPPKMLTLTDEIKKSEVNSVNSVLTAEELVEGIMVNLFWNAEGGTWYIATKSCVGEVSFDHIIQAEAEAQAAAAAATATASTEGETIGDDSTKGFQRLGVQELLRRRICEVLCLLPNGVELLPKQYCYSLVVQHPKNQIVNVISVPKLYLVAVYEITAQDGDADGVNVIRINRDIFSSNFGGSVSHMPSTLTCVLDDTETEAATATATAATATFTPHTVEDYIIMYASDDTRSVSLPGVVFVDKDTGFCYKQRNPKYESVKKRKGMEQKLIAQYLQLRKDRAIDEYLKYHPQHSRAFRQFRDRLHDYTQRLYDAYIEHYVKKNAKPLKDYDRELKTHMYKLHYDVYLATMKPTGVFVTKHAVINYVNLLAPAQQLVCLNAMPASSATNTDAGAGATTDTDAQRKPFQKRQIERSNPIDRSGGFRSTRLSRGGRMVPSLTVHIPNPAAAAAAEVDERVHVKGAKATGCVKVHNSFAGLDVD